MSIKGAEDITITLKRTTVAKMRNAKRGLNWNDYVLHLMKADRQGARAKCVFCGDTLETEDIYKSGSDLSRENGWSEIAVKGRLNGIGFICRKCALKKEEDR